MRESSTYQMILDEGRVEGRVEEARTLLVQLGVDKFGVPSEDASQALETIADVERLERLIRRILRARSWDELLQDG